MQFLLEWLRVCLWPPGNQTWCWPRNTVSRTIRIAGRRDACLFARSSRVIDRCDMSRIPWCNDVTHSRSVWAGNGPWWSVAGCRPWNHWYPTQLTRSPANAWVAYWKFFMKIGIHEIIGGVYLPMECFANVCEVGERRLLGADTQYLWRTHNEFRFPTSGHVRIFVQNNLENALQQLLVRVVTIGTGPCATAVFNC